MEEEEEKWATMLFIKANHGGAGVLSSLAPRARGSKRQPTCFLGSSVRVCFPPAIRCLHLNFDGDALPRMMSDASPHLPALFSEL
jgi:hypothetical protein